MMYRQDPKELAALEERAVADAIRGESHAVTGWIAGISVGLIPLTGGALSISTSFSPYSTGIPWVGIGCIAATIALVPITVGLVRWANASTAARVRRFVREGTRHQGRIVQARRVSMTQSKIIVQGAGFVACEVLLATSIPDAVLFGQVVDVYVHPRIGGAPLVLVPEQMPNPAG
jgi:hypothetical protein